MNKILKILNDTIRVDDARTTLIGYVKSYPATPKTVGEIIFTIPFSNETDSYYTASPLQSSFFTMPVVGELVLILKIDNIYYYTGRFQFSSAKNKEFLLEYIDERNSGIDGAKNDFDNVTKEIFPTKIKLKQVNKAVGETFIESNFNNDIILGYDDKGDSKLSIIQNREDSSYDLNTSGLHFRTNKKITDEITYPKDINIEDDNMNFILLTEDALNFVSKLDDIILSSNNKVIINAKNDINIDGDKSININTSDDMKINGNKIYIGKDANEAAVLGDKLESLLNDIISNIDEFYQAIIKQGSASVQTGYSTLIPNAITGAGNLAALKLKVSQIKSTISKVK